MSWLSTYLADRRQRKIEDEERFHRHWIESTQGAGTHSIAQNLASHRAAIVALQAENKRLSAMIADLSDRVAELEYRLED